MKRLFIDAGAFFAAANPGDQHQQDAARGWRLIEDEPFELISSEHVLDEVVTGIARVQGGRRAARWAREHLSEGLFHWLQPTAADLRHAIDLMEKFHDQDLSFTDAISFALMARMKIRSVFGFDHHFALAGFEFLPGE